MLTVDGLSLARGGRQILTGVELKLAPGEVRLLVGASGSGKTTLLRSVAGLEVPDAGRILLDDRLVTAPGEILVEPHARGIALTFQDGALWPHLTVDQHLYYSRNARDNREWTERILEITGLAARRRDYPHMLSGGELQRIALARALSGRPRLLLLDEPLRNIDANLAREMRDAIVAILDELSITSIFVTHDQEEALSTADRILLMNRSGQVQLGTPHEVYNNPVTPWAFRFFGTVNVFEGRADARGTMETPLGSIDTGLAPDTPCKAFYRPAQILIVSEKDGTSAKVTATTLLGDVTQLTVDVAGTVLHAVCCGAGPAVGARIGIRAGSLPIVFGDGDRPTAHSNRNAHVD